MTNCHHTQRLAEYLIRRACRHLPEDTRDERYREWTAELPAILTDPDTRFQAIRAAHALLYAADQARGAHRYPRPAEKPRTANEHQVRGHYKRGHYVRGSAAEVRRRSIGLLFKGLLGLTIGSSLLSMLGILASTHYAWWLCLLYGLAVLIGSFSMARTWRRARRQRSPIRLP